MCYSLEACCPTETLLKTGRTRLLLSGDITVRASPSQARTVCWGCRRVRRSSVCWLPPRARAHVANDLRARKACCPVMHGRLLLLSSPVKQQTRRACGFGGAAANSRSVGRSVSQTYPLWLVRRPIGRPRLAALLPGCLSYVHAGQPNVAQCAARLVSAHASLERRHCTILLELEEVTHLRSKHARILARLCLLCPAS